MNVRNQLPGSAWPPLELIDELIVVMLHVVSLTSGVGHCSHPRDPTTKMVFVSVWPGEWRTQSLRAGPECGVCMNWIRRILIFTLCSQPCPNIPDWIAHSRHQLSELDMCGQISSTLDNISYQFSHSYVVLFTWSKSSGVQSTHTTTAITCYWCHTIIPFLSIGAERGTWSDGGGGVVSIGTRDRGGQATLFFSKSMFPQHFCAVWHTHNRRLTKVNWKIESRG